MVEVKTILAFKAVVFFYGTVNSKSMPLSKEAPTIENMTVGVEVQGEAG